MRVITAHPIPEVARDWLIRSFKIRKPIKPNLDIEKIVKKNRQAIGKHEGVFVTVKDQHNRRIILHYKKIMKQFPGRFATPSILCLDGDSLRTTRAFIHAGIDPVQIGVANPDPKIIEKLNDLGVVNAFPDMVEGIVDEKTGLDLKGKKFAVVYLDYCGTIFGSEFNGSPDFAFQNCLEHYVDVGSHIALTVSILRNPKYHFRNSAGYIHFIKLYVKLQLAKHGWVGDITYHKKYDKNMLHLGVDIIKRM
jgi:hypothetical protein